ncbi:helix-turn-helix domain-containing protein [Amaricoccus solimangrovi]|nr:helix-turn-helix transcriptional regulator [Amaricoccus solimangrovi]
MLSRLAQNIEHWRQIRGYSQSQLSQRAGLSATAVNDIFRTPDRSPRLQTVEQIAAALDITLWQLLEGAEGPERPETPPPPAGAVSARGAVTIVEQGEFTAGERAQLEAYPPEQRERIRIAVAIGPDAMIFGILPGERVAIIPLRDYSGRLVVVTSESGEATLRYCLPPWLVEFHPGAAPSHEFMERPGLKVVGAISGARAVNAGAEARFPAPEG